MPVEFTDLEEIPEATPDGEDGVSNEVWSILGVGVAIALLVHSMSFLRTVLWHLSVVIHELGHAVTGFLFGYPSIPALDFRYGGGVTFHQHRSLLLLVIVYGLFALALHVLRGNRRGMILVAVLGLLFALAAHTRLHRVIILFAGHGAELLFGAIFFVRAMRPGFGDRYVERPLFAACGSFFVLTNALFSWGLMTDAVARMRYGNAKGGGHWMDFSRIAGHLGVDLETVAAFFFLCCLLTPVVAVAVGRWSRVLHRHVHELLAIEAPDVATS